MFDAPPAHFASALPRVTAFAAPFQHSFWRHFFHAFSSQTVWCPFFFQPRSRTCPIFWGVDARTPTFLLQAPRRFTKCCAATSSCCLQLQTRQRGWNKGNKTKEMKNPDPVWGKALPNWGPRLVGGSFFGLALCFFARGEIWENFGGQVSCESRNTPLPWPLPGFSLPF